MTNFTPSLVAGPITSLVAMALLSASPATAAAPTPPPVDFNRDVRSILSVHCLKCHGRDRDARRAGLRLDLRESSTATLESGRIAIVPGLLFVQVIGACEQILSTMKSEGKHPAPITEMSPGGAFGRAGAADWDPRREIYREAAPQAAE